MFVGVRATLTILYHMCAVCTQVDAADVKTDPAAPVKTEPGAVKTEPETVKIEPGAVKTEPEAMKTEPGAVKTEPDASASAQATDGGAASKAARSGPVFLPAAPLLGVIRAPQIEGYRNKSEFTCGHDAKGDVCTGFLLGNMAVSKGCTHTDAHMDTHTHTDAHICTHTHTHTQIETPKHMPNNT